MRLSTFSGEPKEEGALVQDIVAVCVALSAASTGVLFLLRVRAVYLQSIWITLVFGTIWLVSISLNIWTGILLGASKGERQPRLCSCLVYCP